LEVCFVLFGTGVAISAGIKFTKQKKTTGIGFKGFLSVKKSVNRRRKTGVEELLKLNID
jgi:hypothetical protein